MLNKIGVDACVLGPSLNLWQHIDVEQDRGKRVCFQAFPTSLAEPIDVEQDRGKRLCFGDLSSKPLTEHIDVEARWQS